MRSSSFTPFLAAAAPSPDGRQPSLLVQFVPFLVIIGIFYFLIFAPMRKKQKAHAEMLGKLRAGDRVLTNGGIYGTIVGVSDGVVQLRIADQVKVEVSRSAISSVERPGESS